MVFSRKRSQAMRQRASTPPPPPDQYSDPVRVSVVPEELIAARAYEKWQLRGCPMGQDGLQDWLAAKAELEEERLSWAAPEPSDRLRGV
jgi:hypothetical protein